MILNCNTEVEQFIEDWYNHFSIDVEDQEKLRAHYRSGYCWHFAHMLQTTFNRGQVCWAAPFGHVIWLDTDNTPYDCEGVYQGEAFYFIPEECLPDFAFDDFKHISGKGTGLSKEAIIELIKSYCKLTAKEYDSRLEDYF
jgi:hypothetical protein